MNIRKVAITGIGSICGLGHNTDEIWNNSLKAQSGIKLIQADNADQFPVKFAGLIDNFEISEGLLTAKEQSRYDRFIHLALHSTDEAIKQSGLLEAGYDPYRIGSILGTGLGGFPFIENTHKTFLEKGPRRVSPFFVPSFIPNMATGKISMLYNFKGINHAVSSACASSAHAIAAAATEIMLGRCDAIVTGGAEAVVSPLTITGFNAMKALSKDEDNYASASRPFDKTRSGFVMGEGAGILILEDLEKAKARGAKILAQVVGFGATADAYHITSPHPEGQGTIPCMKQALDNAGITPDKIDYINAHGTSTPLGDIAETKAIKAVFGEHANKLNVSSTKSMTGHLLGAAAGIESVFCVKAIMEQTVPPTAHLNEQDELCDLNYTANEPQKRNIEYTLNNSFGFGGTNSTLIFKRYND
ncbi:MAG: beta-ketoacyl-ACP synthase II [Bacteriovoracaceae bacterium]|jgi:3-oxoacyl-[acyl-carrier-protein] synthase II|nr:beta-ketoacyl-ACP synthase II [Bacteriovoracaceae bacterium]